MTRQDAQNFFREYSEWLADDWMATPGGREYKARFDEAVSAIMTPDIQPVIDVEPWEIACAEILRQPRCHGWQATNPYVQAIKMTRATFGCSLIDSKNRVDALRGQLGL